MARDAADRGAETLLRRCARVQPGERLLIAHESACHGYFEAGVARRVHDVARRLALRVEMVETGFHPDAPRISPDLAARMAAADVTVFLSRLGDQLRFAGLPGGRVVVCFALSEAMLASSFATTDPGVFTALKGLVEDRIAQAREIRITCPRGTDVRGQARDAPPFNAGCQRFPVSIFAPVPAGGFSGRIAVPGFFSGSGAHYHADSMLEFSGPLSVIFHKGRICGFEGGEKDVARATAHYRSVAGRYDADAGVVHSWHAGIHPGCGFPWDARRHMDRWSGAAFGNPRVLHFHSCGATAPGEICLNVIDPTVSLDGVALWSNGRFHPERLPGGAALVAADPEIAALFREPVRDIGLDAGEIAVPSALVH